MPTLNISLPQEQITTFCHRWHITELALFGSVLRDDFHPNSDIDVLVTFAPDAKRGLLAIAPNASRARNHLWARRGSRQQTCDRAQPKLDSPQKHSGNGTGDLCRVTQKHWLTSLKPLNGFCALRKTSAVPTWKPTKRSSPPSSTRSPSLAKPPNAFPKPTALNTHPSLETNGWHARYCYPSLRRSWPRHRLGHHSNRSTPVACSDRAIAICRRVRWSRKLFYWKWVLAQKKSWSSKPSSGLLSTLSEQYWDGMSQKRHSWKTGNLTGWGSTAQRGDRLSELCLKCLIHLRSLDLYCSIWIN